MDYFVIATVRIGGGEWDFSTTRPMEETWATILLQQLAGGPFEVLEARGMALDGAMYVLVRVKVWGEQEFGSEELRAAWADIIVRELRSDPRFVVVSARAVAAGGVA